MAASFRWDNFVLDADGYRLEKAGVAVPLEPKAFNLLSLFVQRPGHLFSKQEIFDAVWPDTAVTDHALTRVIAQLRRALGDEAREARYIETVPTRGYRWIRPVEPVDLDVATPPSSRVTVTQELANSTVQALVQERRARRWMPGIFAMAGLGAAVVALVIWAQRGTPTSATGTYDRSARGSVSRAADVAWPVQITTHRGLDLHPALSPQGDAVAYVSDRTGAFEIYVRALRGTATDTALTSDGGQNVQPAWSPDGRYLAYHSYKRGGIWLIPARGGVPRQVAASGSNPAWSPDGTRLAFQSDEHADVTPTAWLAQTGSTISIVDADGRNTRQVTKNGNPTGGHGAPAWSPDGRFLAFTVFDVGPDGGLWLLNLASNSTTALERGQGLFEAVFSPDNRSIYVAGGQAVISRVPFDPATGTRRGPRELVPIAGVAGVRGLTIAADGRRLAFAGLTLSSHIWAQPVRPDGSAAGPASPLTSDTSRRNSLPAISPDGSRVAYLSTRGGQSSDVWVMSINGREPIQVTADEGAESKPGWFPDGRRVAYLSLRKSAAGIFAVDVLTRREEQVFDFTRYRHQASPSAAKGWFAEFELAPSVKMAAFSIIPPGGLRTMHVSGFNPFSPRPITDGSVSVGYPSWSPDERQIAVEIKDGSSTQAGIIDVATGKMRRLTNERGQTWVSSWSPDGRFVVAASLRDGLWCLEAIDAATGRHTTMTPPSPPHVYLRYPEWSPRGNLIVFERGELQGNIWTLELR